MELEKILNNYLEGKEIIKENNDMNSLNNNLDDEDLYEDDEDQEDQDLYEDEGDDEDYDDEDEDEEDDSDEDFEEIDIETITDLEKMKIVCDILNHIENDYPGLEKIITTLQDIIEDNQY
jgi:hypothetical protein